MANAPGEKLRRQMGIVGLRKKCVGSGIPTLGFKHDNNSDYYKCPICGKAWNACELGNPVFANPITPMHYVGTVVNFLTMKESGAN